MDTYSIMLLIVAGLSIWGTVKFIKYIIRFTAKTIYEEKAKAEAKARESADKEP